MLGILGLAQTGLALAVDTTPKTFKLTNAVVYSGSRELPDAVHLIKPFKVTGIDSPSPISITGAGEYSINGAGFGSAPAWVLPGDEVVVHVLAANADDTTVKATLTIGGVSASQSVLTTLAPSTTLTALPGTTALVYRNASPANLSLFVYKPTGWHAEDSRAAMLCIFGGGWVTGNPTKDLPKGLAAWAASKGMVGITPDYRTNERFATTPLQQVDDARAALRWVQDNHASLGVDPSRIVTCGSSTGAHLALWTAISATPPGSDPQTAPLVQPVATILVSAIFDTSPMSGFHADRFGAQALALSPFHQPAAYMPPTLMFHGTADKLLPYAHAVEYCDALRSHGNACQLVPIQGAPHVWFDSHKFKPATRAVYDSVGTFLQQLGILVAPASPMLR